jgi:uncharacterized protein YdeI (YjbR/CyaY-like superfamily)
MDDNEHRGGLPIRLFEDRAVLNDWFSTESRTSKGLWLRFAKKGSGLVSVSKSEAIDAALCHGWIDGQIDKYDDTSWIVRFTPRKHGSKWSAVNRGRAMELIDARRMRPAGLAEIEAAKADCRWAAAYAPASQAEVPADLQFALDRSPAAAQFFATLTGANRYAILYRIGAVKKRETRARRVSKFVAMLERGETVHGPKSV